MKPVSDKRRAERLANGERFIGSSIAPKPVQPQPSSGYCPIRRKRKVKKVNKKRRVSEWARAYGSKARVEWIKAQPSVASGLGPCVNAHVKNGGAGRKADAKWIVPLTDQEHKELHRVGIDTFEKEHWLELEYFAQKTEADWQAHSQRGES